MLVIAVTGGIGSGKSTATAYFGSKGAVVLDLDRVAHRLLEPGTATHEAVVAAFGAGVLDGDGRIDRVALAREAFASQESCRRLNRTVHPAVAEVTLARIDELRSQPDPPSVVVMEVPLLVEAPAFAAVADLVLAISGSEELRVARCVAFGRDEEDARARMACQASDAQRHALADRTIENEGTLEGFLGELERFWDEVVEPRAA